MGYNLKNTRNGKSASKIPKWPSLRPQELTSKFIPQFDFSETLEDLYGKLKIHQVLTMTSQPQPRFVHVGDTISIGPLQLGSRDQIFPRKFLYYGLKLKEYQKWKERIENTKMAQFEAPGIEE